MNLLFWAGTSPLTRKCEFLLKCYIKYLQKWVLLFVCFQMLSPPVSALLHCRGWPCNHISQASTCPLVLSEVHYNTTDRRLKSEKKRASWFGVTSWSGLSVVITFSKSPWLLRSSNTSFSPCIPTVPSGHICLSLDCLIITCLTFDIFDYISSKLPVLNSSCSKHSWWFYFSYDVRHYRYRALCKSAKFVSCRCGSIIIPDTWFNYLCSISNKSSFLCNR